MMGYYDPVWVGRRTHPTYCKISENQKFLQNQIYRVFTDS